MRLRKLSAIKRDQSEEVLGRRIFDKNTSSRPLTKEQPKKAEEVAKPDTSLEAKRKEHVVKLVVRDEAQQPRQRAFSVFKPIKADNKMKPFLNHSQPELPLVG